MKLSELDQSEVTIVPPKLVAPKEEKASGPAVGEYKSGPLSQQELAKSAKLAKDPMAEGDVDVNDPKWQRLTGHTPEDEKSKEEKTAARDFLGFAGGSALGEIAGPLLGKGINAAAKKMGPIAENRIAERTINDMARGGESDARTKLGTVKNEIKEIGKTDPELMKKPKDSAATGEAIEKALDKRTAELDRRYESAANKYVSDPNAPTHVEDEPTSQLSKPNFTPSRRQITGTVQGENPILPSNDKALIDTKSPVPNEVPEEATARIESSSKPRTESLESAPIEMRPNGSLLPHEVKASIISKANELERTSAPQSDAVVKIHGNLEREIAAETKATHDDPSLRWWRQKATDYQRIANKHAHGAEETANQAAHEEVANTIKDALEKHMQDPEVNRLNAEVSALMKLKKVNDGKIARENAPGSSPGKYGSRLANMFKGTADAVSIASALATGNPAPLIIPAAIHGGPIAASVADRMIAKIASAAARGADTAPLVTQALKSGISQAQIDQTMGAMKRK
jgi:hypothetical protein